MSLEEELAPLVPNTPRPRDVQKAQAAVEEMLRTYGLVDEEDHALYVAAQRVFDSFDDGSRGKLGHRE